MAELATVARPYAEALFRVAKSGNLAAWSDLVSEMAHVAAHPDVQALSHNPNVPEQQVAATFLALLKSPAWATPAVATPLRRAAVKRSVLNWVAMPVFREIFSDDWQQPLCHGFAALRVVRVEVRVSKRYSVALLWSALLRRLRFGHARILL